MSLFRGFRTDKGCVVLRPNGKPLLTYQGVRNHTDHFEWQGDEQGELQLAIAILCEAVGKERAQEYYAAFCERIVRKLDGGSWVLSDTLIANELAAIERDAKVEKDEKFKYLEEDLPF